VTGVEWVRFVVASLAVGLFIGCARPEAPTLTPTKVTVTAISPSGLNVMLDLAIDNPNKIDLAARQVAGRVTLDGRYDLGSFAVSQPFRLPARQRSELAVPFALAWKDIAGIAAVALTAGGRNVPYDVDGKVTVGGESLNVDLPFHLRGEVTHEQFVRATANSLPRFP
jgi:LEA14-like dessication related protein